MAHLGVGILVLGLLSLVGAAPVLAPLFVIPVLLSTMIVRYRTVADRDGIVVRTLFRSQELPWEGIDGLQFGRGSWAVAHCTDGSQVRLPAVTFATLPLLTGASDGRVPNPYARGN
ncbi:PH domain-containing protein [Mycolicibacterium thermoresistibile]